MNHENNLQPLDTIMNQLGLSNADLVNASTEQLSFKMVNKGRKGRELTPNIQDKIWRALLTVKPELKLRRRDLFRYEPEESVVEQITKALVSARNRKIKYPEFVDLLDRAGIKSYIAEVGPNRITFYGTAGKAHTEEGAAISLSAPGYFDQAAIQSAILEAQKALIDHATFLKRIHEAGIGTYEVNVKRRTIEYRGEKAVYKEKIPQTGAVPEPEVPKEIQLKNKAKAAKKKLTKQKHLTTKARMALKKHRYKKRAAKRSSRAK